MEDKKIRALRADEVEVRIGTVFKTGVTLLLYKNARVDMNILDETFGTLGWQKDLKEIKGNLYCGIGVRNDFRGEWVWKWACGSESNVEKEKGEDSDAMKRAGFLWNIGRELYTTPVIAVKVDTVEDNKKYRMKNPADLKGMYVSKLSTAEIDGKRIITELEIKKGDGTLIREWKYGSK